MLLTPGADRADGLTDDTAVLSAMLSVESAWAGVLGDLGVLTPQQAQVVADACNPSRYDVSQLAANVESGGNPAIPVVAALRAQVAESDSATAALVHKGLTSQDLIDTAVMLIARDCAAQLQRSLLAATDAVADLAQRERGTVMTARTLGQPAVPTTFGAKAAGWLRGLDDALRAVSALNFPVQCGGAAGTLSLLETLAPGLAATAPGLLADRLGLTEPVGPWHTDRSPVTALGDGLTRASDILGKIAGDIVLAARPEIGELSEPPAPGRGGSSTMPQKHNPVLSVLVRSAALQAPHLSASLHTSAALAADERPDGAWHAEWQPVMSLLTLVPTAASQAAEVLSGLEVHREAMQANVDAAMPALVAERRSVRPDESVSAADYLGVVPALIDRTLDGHATLRKELDS